MGEEIFITCTRNYEWVCALLFIGLIAFSTSLVGNYVICIGYHYFYVVRNKDW